MDIGIDRWNEHELLRWKTVFGLLALQFREKKAYDQEYGRDGPE